MSLETVAYDKQITNTNVAIGAASASGVIPAGSAGYTVQFTCTSPCYFKLGYGGAPTATTSDLIIPGPWLVNIHISGDATHWAVLQVGAAGFASMSYVHED